MSGGSSYNDRKQMGILLHGRTEAREDRRIGAVYPRHLAVCRSS